MKEKVQIAIAAILLSSGIAIALYNASSAIVAVGSGLRHMANHQEQHHRITLLSEHGIYPPDRSFNGARLLARGKQ